jgi:hypothetical protein
LEEFESVPEAPDELPREDSNQIPPNVPVQAQYHQYPYRPSLFGNILLLFTFTFV